MNGGNIFISPAQVAVSRFCVGTPRQVLSVTGANSARISRTNESKKGLINGAGRWGAL